MPLKLSKNKIRISYFCFIFFILFLISLIFIPNKNITQAGDAETMSGWLWSSNFKWISLNSVNCVNLGGGTCVINEPSVNYGVTVADDGGVRGEAWSEDYGWICFGDTCDDWSGSLPHLALAPDGETATSSFDGIKFTGWANIVSLEDSGWIKLQADEGSASTLPEGSQYPACFNCEAAECDTCFTETSGDGLKGNVCYDCSECDLSSPPDECDTCDNCRLYGLIAEGDDNRVYGWAWGGDDGVEAGAGWVKADYDFNTFYIPPIWLETKYGNIYSKDLIDAGPAPPGHYNATYCIITSEAGGSSIVSFKSAKNCEITGFEDIIFPNSGNLYTNVLGEIDIEGLEDGLYGEVVEIDKADAFVQDLTGGETDSDIELGGKIYHIKGNFTVDKELTILSASSGDGRGLIIVDGHMYVDDNIEYGDTFVTNIRDLASVGWIIKKNLNIHGNTTKMVGAFYVEGSDGVPSNAAVDTVYDGPVADKMLRIYGLMIAPKYDFKREYSSITRGSEQIIYDGRTLINIPPGMDDLTEALPIWRESAP